MATAIQERTSETLARLGPLRIGPFRIDRPFVLAPMAGVSEAPFRSMVLEMGAGLAPTELVSAKGLHWGNARTEGYLRHDPEREPLLAVQLYGADPAAMADAAERAVERGARMVDVNMGCPVKKITKNQAGSALLRDEARATAVIEAIVQRLGDGVPVTAKLRSGWDEDHINAPQLGQRLRDAGVAALALHPRTRRQGYEGRADWRVIRDLKAAVGDLAVIANGDVDGAESAARVVRETGCDAVMVGRAALGNPWVFRELAAVQSGAEPRTPTPPERVGIVLRHLGENVEHHQDEERALKKFRQHLVWYSRGLRGNVAFREHVLRLERRSEVEAAIEDFFGRARPVVTEAAEYDARRAYG